MQRQGVATMVAAALGLAAALGGPPRPDASAKEPSAAAKKKAKEADVKVVAGPPRSSPFLRPPGSRYDPDAIDWRDVPPWRQASFFGLRAQGRFFVYVVDCSGSMLDEDRLARAKQELRRSILELRQPQQFKVIFYNDRPIPMPGDLPCSADQDAKARLIHWLRLIEPDGTTDPRAAMGLALSYRPDAVFLLSDGEFPDGTVEAVAAGNRRKIPIHCVDLSGGLGGDHLQRIARESGGRYVSRPTTDPELAR